MTEATATAGEIAAAIRGSMAGIRQEVEAGTAGLIEADAVLMDFGARIAETLSTRPGFDRRAFEDAADLNDPIPEEEFLR